YLAQRELQSLPTRRSSDLGEQKWYQRITVGYSLQGQNRIVTTDSLLFRKESLKKFTNGMQHNIPVSLSLNVMKYFQFNSSFNYRSEEHTSELQSRENLVCR